MTVTVEAGVSERAATPSGEAGPALRLGGRFRLDERISAACGPGARAARPGLLGATSMWKATDGLLGRPVTIYLLPGRVPQHVVTAVQAAARVNDPRLATVYDTDFCGDMPYLVSEWTPGTHLEDLVLSGLPRPALAAAMISDAAAALALAHEAGRPHLCLGPRSLSWDTRSGLKITGLGIDAALSGADEGARSGAEAAAETDTMALGRMLYALLTGFWPGPENTSMPAAPRHKGGVYTPRQVRAGVPGVLDAITCHALGLHPAGVALSPAGLSAALRAVHRPSCPPYRPALPAVDSVREPGPGRHPRHARLARARGVRLAA
jgi:serine/threonine protein kinase